MLACVQMSKFTHIILGILCAFLLRICAGLDVSGDYVFGNEINTNEEIHITGSGIITNYGNLGGKITIDSGVTVIFQNFGNITSNFNVSDDAEYFFC